MNSFITKAMSRVRSRRLAGATLGTVLSLVITFVGGLSAQTQTAAGPTKLRDILGTDAMIYVDIPDFQSTIKRGHDIALAKILREEEFVEFLGPIWKLLRGRIDAGLKEIGEKPEDWNACPLRSIEMAFASVEGSKSPLVLIRLDSGKVNSVLLRLLQRDDMKGMVNITDQEGAKIVTFGPVQNGAAALLGDSVLLVIDPATIYPEDVSGVAAHVLKAMKAPAPKTALTADADFKNLVSKMQTKEPEWIAFARPNALMSMMLSAGSGGRRSKRAGFPDPTAIVGEAMKNLGMTDFRALLITEGYQAGMVNMEVAAIVPPASPIVAMSIGNGSPVDRAFLEKAVDGVDAFKVTMFDSKPMYRVLRSMLANLLPQEPPASGPSTDSRPAPPDPVAQLEKTLNVNFETDFVNLLGPEMYSYSFPPKAGTGPVPTFDSFFVIKIKDKARIEKMFSSIADFVNAQEGAPIGIDISEPTKTRPAIYSMRMKDEDQGNPAAAFISAQLSFAVAMMDDWMIASTNVIALKNELRNMTKPRDAAAEVKTLLAAMPADASSLHYTDWKPLVRSMWDALASFAGMAGGSLGAEMPIDLQKIPTSQSIVKHFIPSRGYWRITKDGIYGQSSGSFGLELPAAAFGLGAAVAGVLQSERRGPAEPFVYEVEEDETPASAPKDANRIRALNDLSKLEMAIIIYRAENGKFPATLDELVKATDDHKEGYLAGWTEIPKDPWGSAYTYTFSESTKMTTLRSLGPNKQDDGGAGDDVSAGSK